jgi:hypothetical protein
MEKIIAMVTVQLGIVTVAIAIAIAIAIAVAVMATATATAMVTCRNPVLPLRVLRVFDL